MHNKHNKHFLKLWESKRRGDDLPLLSHFSREDLQSYSGHEVLLRLIDGVIVYGICSKSIRDVLSEDLTGKPVLTPYPKELWPVQTELISVAFENKVGLVRLSRFWYGHRHKDVEWLLLPVEDDECGGVALLGLSASDIAYDKRDVIPEGNMNIERLVTQEYLTLGRSLNLNKISGKTWTYLHAMGSIVSIDHEIIEPEQKTIIGRLGMAAAKTSRPNVLAVSSVSDLRTVLSRFGARYNLKLVQSGDEAIDIMKMDVIDVILVCEILPDGSSGLELLAAVKELCPEAGLVMMLENRAGAEDQVLKTTSGLVHCLVKPVGEFALRQAIDDANLLVKQRIRDEASH